MRNSSKVIDADRKEQGELERLERIRRNKKDFHRSQRNEENRKEKSRVRKKIGRNRKIKIKNQKGS